MDTGIRPISVSTAFSLGLHAAFAVAILQTQDVIQATGKGIEIELVSSSYVSDQSETEQAARKAVSSAQQFNDADESNYADTQTPSDKLAGVAVAESAMLNKHKSSESETIDNDSGEQVSTRSTNSAQQKTSIIELLHTKISAHKQYPYLARRQRREGIARVEFVLNPDGTIIDPRLVNSSRTRALDKAALEAVKGIEPFRPAKDYIDQPESYQVDVVFNVY